MRHSRDSTHVANDSDGKVRHSKVSSYVVGGTEGKMRHSRSITNVLIDSTDAVRIQSCPGCPQELGESWRRPYCWHVR